MVRIKSDITCNSIDFPQIISGELGCQPKVDALLFVQGAINTIQFIWLIK